MVLWGRGSWVRIWPLTQWSWGIALLCNTVKPQRNLHYTQQQNYWKIFFYYVCQPISIKEGKNVPNSNCLKWMLLVEAYIWYWYLNIFKFFIGIGCKMKLDQQFLYLLIHLYLFQSCCFSFCLDLLKKFVWSCCIIIIVQTEQLARFV